MYASSLKNSFMVIYLLAGDWLKAAEIYKKETKNKNENIAAKATYNMALICEMEGNLDVAIDWLDRSNSVYKRKNYSYIYMIVNDIAHYWNFERRKWNA